MIGDKKATIIVLGAVVLLILLISVPIVLLTNEDDNKFGDSSITEITEGDVNNPDSESYMKIKNELENDYYFKRAALISNYNYKTYTSADIEKMLWYFIFLYDKNNGNISYKEREKGIFCLRDKYVVEAFEELYGVNINKDIDYLEGYYQYVEKDYSKYCFDYSNVSYEYNNNEILIGIDGIEVEDNIVTTNLYVYEFYSMDSDNELLNKYSIKDAIKASNYEGAKSIVLDFFNGKVTHKQLHFKINKNAEHFKYQILISKMLDY